MQKLQILSKECNRPHHVPPHISDMGTNLKGEPVTMAEDRGITLEEIWKLSFNGCVVVL
jgi:hypothetical protein